MSEENKIRLSKLMADRGLCSRREADEYIAKGLVFVNGEQVSQLGIKFSPDVHIELAAKAQQKQNELVTVILNKPIGYVSAQPEKGYQPAIQLLTEENFDPQFGKNTRSLIPRNLNDLAVAGRLDIDSQGLLVFTQDGRIAKKIIGEDSQVEKEYLVRVKGKLDPKDLARLQYGLELDGQKLKRAQVDWINQDQLKFVLTEGKKRQVRRMCELVGLQVLGLKRVRVGNVKLGPLTEGKWRFLSKDEKF